MNFYKEDIEINNKQILYIDEIISTFYNINDIIDQLNFLEKQLEIKFFQESNILISSGIFMYLISLIKNNNNDDIINKILQIFITITSFSKLSLESDYLLELFNLIIINININNSFLELLLLIFHNLLSTSIENFILKNFDFFIFINLLENPEINDTIIKHILGIFFLYSYVNTNNEIDYFLINYTFQLLCDDREFFFSDCLSILIMIQNRSPNLYSLIDIKKFLTILNTMLHGIDYDIIYSSLKSF